MLVSLVDALALQLYMTLFTDRLCYSPLALVLPIMMLAAKVLTVKCNSVKSV